MKTATYKGQRVRVLVKSTKNCRISYQLTRPIDTNVEPEVTQLVPTSSLTFHNTPVAKVPTATFQDVYEEFLTLAANLSPENLTCDGELSRSRVRIRYNQLKAQWAALEEKIGMKVTEDMVWGKFTASR